MIFYKYILAMLEKFDEKYLPQLVERVLPLWNVDGASTEFNRKYVEMIIRTNMHENQMQFQLTQENQLCSIAFGAAKTDTSNTTWLNEQLNILDEQGKNSFIFGRKYLLMMEEKTFSYMNEDDVKLCLFVSLKKGYGKKILDETMEFFRSQGYKNMYLWTDGECNVQWYFDHDYQLILQEEYQPFSTPQEPYMTYIFKKEL